MKKLILTLLLVILLAVGLKGIAKVYEPLILFHPDLSLELTPELMGMSSVEAPIRSGDRWLYGWLIKADSDRYCVFFHGNAGNIADRLDFAKTIAPLKLNLLLFDYQGYGRSEGIPSIDGVEQDAVAAVTFLHEKGKVPLNRIVLWGRSLGGALA
ncbi:MAG: alpha/beta hydrolase, partial [Nitrospinae bacterium]|nr:alpha/beta hydrolase [Nitrospinota bacterium]